ncbi:MAG: tRNA (N(6)-L-threonylcarbamoyladenosine(37)-C(2))-methylthiotransferase MtaB [Clostridium sp.]|nr:tRNA (N(6)-L-threonylcarbamoyladenosine(37)-C(2))-methylthiotransferase MtaB [Clostridium sp.]
MKVAFQTLGCRVNVYDSEAMTELFLKDGYEIVDFSEYSDVYVVNTCTVTNNSDKKSRQYINRAKRLNPNATVAVVGCYPQVNKEKINEMDGIDVILGSRNKGDIVYAVNKSMAEKKKVVKVSESIILNNKFEDLNITDYEDKTRAFLKIQDGCNRFCSYCIIPYARGGISSKDPKKIINEVKLLSENGFKEVIFSGIHIASYGQEFKNRYDLLDLLEEINKIEGIERIRIGSIEPMFFHGKRMDRIKNINKLCPHFHLSLQSGSNKTLKRMNRRYTKEEYQEVVDKLREEIKDVSITTDVIVGFPGESEEEFNESLEFLKNIKLNKIHTFKYSIRKNTPAANMKKQVNGNIKDERSKLVIDLSEKYEKQYLEDLVGSTVEVLMEKDHEGVFAGYTGNYNRVEVKSNKDLRGQIKKVFITGVDENSLVAKGNVL